MRGLITILLLLLLAFGTFSAAHAGGPEIRVKMAKELTGKYRAMGAPILFAAKGNQKNVIQITQKNIIQPPRLTEGQMVTVLGTYLGDGAQERLKKEGFARGEFVDGKARKYHFAL
jgi:hypothetical protein